MSNYKQSNDEIIKNKVDTNETNELTKDYLTIFLRNIKNETTKISVKKSTTKLIKELKLEVYIIWIRSWTKILYNMNKIIKTLGTESDKTIKLFFRGKPLKDNETIEQHSKN